MTRYFSLYWLFLTQRLKILMEYRANFIIGALSTIALQAELASQRQAIPTRVQASDRGVMTADARTSDEPAEAFGWLRRSPRTVLRNSRGSGGAYTAQAPQEPQHGRQVSKFKGRTMICTKPGSANTGAAAAAKFIVTRDFYLKFRSRR